MVLVILQRSQIGKIMQSKFQIMYIYPVYRITKNYLLGLNKVILFKTYKKYILQQDLWNCFAKIIEQIHVSLFLPGRCTDLTWINDVTVCYTSLWNVILSILISQIDFCNLEIHLGFWDIKIDKTTFQTGVKHIP